MTSIVWLRDDLRLDDQPAIAAAAASPALYVYIHDETSATRPLGGASRWWLDKSLRALSASLEKIGGRLDVLSGPAETLLPALAAHADAIYWNRRYGRAEIETDTRLKARLQADGRRCESFNGRLLREPWDVTNEAGAPFKVFTPFWRKSRAMGAFAAPVNAPRKLHAAPWPKDAPERISIDDLKLHPRKPDWSGGLAQTWTPGEAGARARLSRFVDEAMRDYAEARDRLDGETTSRLSPHLRFGEISPRRIVAVAEAAAARDGTGQGAEKFLSEIGWREFSYALLYAEPELARKNWSPRFDAFPWRRDEDALEAWRRGRTGYPVVDAGMRELWATGYMHNRVRMIAASFLCKHLVIDWRVGRGVVLGHAVRRGRGQQPRELAMGRRLRRRRRALFPRVQPDASGRQVRPGRRLCAPLGSRAARPRRALCSCALDDAGRRSRRLSRPDRRPRPRPGARARSLRRDRRRDGSAQPEAAKEREEERIRQGLNNAHEDGEAQRQTDLEAAARQARLAMRRHATSQSIRNGMG